MQHRMVPDHNGLVHDKVHVNLPWMSFEKHFDPPLPPNRNEDVGVVHQPQLLIFSKNSRPTPILNFYEFLQMANEANRQGRPDWSLCEERGADGGDGLCLSGMEVCLGNGHEGTGDHSGLVVGCRGFR